MKRKTRKKMKNYTIMILPHSNSAPRSLNIPKWVVNGLAVCVLSFIMVVSYLAYSYINLQQTLAENGELRIVNDIQAKEIEKLQSSSEKALEKLEEIAKTDIKIRELVGLEATEAKEPSRSSSQGGPGRQVRSVQALGFTDIDFDNRYNNYQLKSDIDNIKLENLQVLDQSHENNNLDKIEKIKNNLAKVNELLQNQQQTFRKLEVDVQDRLDYLAATPSSWPVRGRITSDFGWRRDPFGGKKWEFHDGLDIAASYGTSVKASGDGKIIYSGWKPVYGYTVIIRHGYGYTSHYGHNSKLYVKAGQNVKKGEVIARVGSTGRSTGPHLDFRVIHNGEWIDPEKVLK